jgi:hypothetical protein
MTIEARAGRTSEVAKREGGSIEEARSASVTHFDDHDPSSTTSSTSLGLLPPAYHPAIMAKETSKLFFCMHWRVALPLRAPKHGWE